MEAPEPPTLAILLPPRRHWSRSHCSFRPLDPKLWHLLQEFPGQATDHRSFLRCAGAVDHETV
ncbi:hypothetical protein LINPERHAP1_LOCUS17850 [Linum perenne]